MVVATNSMGNAVAISMQRTRQVGVHGMLGMETVGIAVLLGRVRLSYANGCSRSKLFS